MMMVVVMVVMRDHHCRWAPHDPRSPDNRLRGVMNGAVRRNLRHDVTRPDDRHDVVVVMMVMRRHDNHDPTMMVVMMMMVMVDI
jgi:hypothetical protein